MAGLKDREHDLEIARERAAITLTAIILLQAVAMFTTASWLPRMPPTGVLGTAVRFTLALTISLVGAGLAVAVGLQVVRIMH